MRFEGKQVLIFSMQQYVCSPCLKAKESGIKDVIVP